MTDVVSTATAEWIRPFEDVRRAPIEVAAATAAHELAAYDFHDQPAGRTAIVVEPGNGWAYRFVLADIGDRPGFGGNLLVALPDWHQSLLLDDHGNALHFPHYIGEKLEGMSAEHIAVIATFLTLFSEALGNVRAAVPASH